MTDETPELDWAHLPAGCDGESLWDCLHDSGLLSCRSDLLNRSVCLEFDVSHLHEKTDELRFLIHLELVSSVRANIYVRWPGEFRLPDGATREEQSRLMAENAAKSRGESLGWGEFEQALASDPLLVMDADLARADGKVALRLAGFLDGEKFEDQYCTVYVRCGGIRAARSDGQPFSLRQLIDLGHEYWEAFAARRAAMDAG